MDLTAPSKANIQFMLDAIQNKLRSVSAGVLNADTFREDQYEDLLDIYEHVNGKSSFSISEVEAIVSELGKMRKKT